MFETVRWTTGQWAATPCAQSSRSQERDYGATAGWYRSVHFFPRFFNCTISCKCVIVHEGDWREWLNINNNLLFRYVHVGGEMHVLLQCGRQQKRGHWMGNLLFLYPSLTSSELFWKAGTVKFHLHWGLGSHKVLFRYIYYLINVQRVTVSFTLRLWIIFSSIALFNILHLH